MNLTVKHVSEGMYSVLDDQGERVAYAISHPRCLPRSWWLKMADGQEIDHDPDWRTEDGYGWRTRKAAVAWLERQS